MRTLTKIVGGIVLAGVLGAGILYGVGSGVSYVEEKKEERVEQRLKIYRTVNEVYEKKQEKPKRRGLESVLSSAITNVLNMAKFEREVFLDEKAYTEHFVKLRQVYPDSIAEGDNHVSRENVDFLGGSVDYARDFAANLNKLMGLVNKHKGIPEENVEKFKDNPDQFLEFLLKQNRGYLKFIDEAERVIDLDLAYLRKADTFTGRRSDEESIEFRKTVNTFIGKREELKDDIGVYRIMIEQSIALLERYSDKEKP